MIFDFDDLKFEVRSITFEDVSGWDNQGFGAGVWDTYDNTYEDEVFYLDGSTQSINLSKALESGVQYHVYRKFRAFENNRWDWKLVRMDDPNFGTSNPVTNQNAVMASLQGDGSTKTVDVFVLRIAAPKFSILVFMETPAQKSLWSSQSNISTLIDLARLLGRQAARELVEAEQATPITPQYKDKGTKND